jgi:ABC-2 type transport system ATP-binding protein
VVPAIEVSSLSKRFGTVAAVRDLSFTADAGRVTGFLGPNGAGKSTTLRALLGLIRPSEGSAHFAGRPYQELEDPTHHVGAILEDTAFHPGRTGRGHLRVLAAAGGHPRGRIDDVLELVDLTGAADRRVKGYSLGMRQRLAIATALLGDPEVLILDEPANGLDPPGIRWLRELMRAQADAGRAVLVSSHQLAEVAQVVDEVVVIAEGRLRAQGPLREVLGQGSDGTVVGALEPSRLADALRAAGFGVQPGLDGQLVVSGARPEDVGRVALEAGVVLTALGERTRSLEEAFFALTGPSGGASGGGPPVATTVPPLWARTPERPA